MSKIAKYNVTKGISTVLTMGTPIITLVCSSAEIITPAGKMSVTACLVCLLVMLFMKDKLAEHLKMPSAFVLSAILFGLILMIEHILIPLKAVLVATMIVSGIDELTFKRIYKNVENELPDSVDKYKHVGFIFTTSKNIGA